jgi:hypothetical protein
LKKGVDMNKFKIRHVYKTPIEHIAKYGIVRIDGRLWRDEVILETDLSFDEVCKLPFVLAVKTLYKSNSI